MYSRKFVKIALVTAACLALTACKTSEEKAKEYYDDGIALLQAGDPDRAIVQLQNVFELDGSHRDARMALAGIFMDKGQKRRAYAQYLRVAEQYPQDSEARMALAEIAFSVNDWEEFSRHAAALRLIDTTSAAARAIQIGAEYQTAVLAEDEPKREAVAAQAAALLAEAPGDSILLHIGIDVAMRASDFDAALKNLDLLIANEPTERLLYNQRLGILAQKDDLPALEQELRRMVTLFPDDTDIKATLVRFYLSRQDIDGAEAFLREISDPADADPAAFLDLIRFVAEIRGETPARAEIQRAIDVNPNPLPFEALLAGMDFRAGKQDEAVARLESLLATAEPSDEVRRIKVVLAQMLLAQNNEVGARNLIEEVLAADASNADALKMKATWQIAADDTDGALASLRLALDSNADDAQTITLMAEAYTRAGSPDLARDTLAQAVAASGNAPDESIRYADVLMADERYLQAEDVLVPALRIAPGNVQLLTSLGGLYIRMKDQARADQVIATLRRLDLPEATLAANTIEANKINETTGIDDAAAYLEQLVGSGSADDTSKVMLARARLTAGEFDAALTIVNELIAKDPENANFQALRGYVLSAAGKLGEAETTLRAVLDEHPATSELWLQLSRIKIAQNDPQAAVAVIEEGLTKIADDPNLLWAKASFLEKTGDIDGAIAVYEGLYTRLSGNVVVANNLASLLSAYRTDQASLDRAFVIARRLVGTREPAFQDTYGWILQLRGKSEEALTYLEPAATNLPRDPLTQYHLGVVYAALARNDDAIAQFQKAADLAGPGDTRPQIETARSEIIRLKEAGTGQ